ncbi:hypothetical protein ACFP6A_13820, partial [Quadrisphaera sp. GCM10027208]|uniref:hypothetical protein n=1 Tax=Quadrisphaera sp. GCM10027208 TaxID=3273423 RepID=UPI0036179473
VDVAIHILPAQEGILALRHAHTAEPGRWIRAEGTTVIASSDSFCAEVTSYADAAHANADTTWGFNQTGLVQGGC